MTTPQAEKEFLAAIEAAEKDISVDVGVDGKVKKTEQEQKQEGSEEGKEEKEEKGSNAEKEKTEKEEATIPTIDQLKSEIIQRDEIIQEILTYTKQVDSSDPDSGRVWDIEKILDELGFDASSLVRKGEKKKTTEKNQKEDSKNLPPQDNSTSSGINEMKDKFNKDPIGFLTAFKDEILTAAKEAAKGEAVSSTADIRKEVQNRRAAQMLEQVRTKYTDFNEHLPTIAKLIKQLPPKDVAGLEALYHAAKGLDGAKSSDAGKTVGISKTNSAAGNKTTNTKKSPADQMFEALRDAGTKPDDVSEKSMKLLFGKSRLSPI